MSEETSGVTFGADEGEHYFEPVHRFHDQVETKTHEEDEDALFKMRAKLFRYDQDRKEWKERGTGDVKILRHTQTLVHRLVMRRDKTLKVCANHLLLDSMQLKPNVGSDRSWVWSVPADLADGVPTAETLAIRFATPDIAGEFKRVFEGAQRGDKDLKVLVPESGESQAAGQANVKDQGESVGKTAPESEVKKDVKQDVKQDVKGTTAQEPVNSSNVTQSSSQASTEALAKPSEPVKTESTKETEPTPTNAQAAHAANETAQALANQLKLDDGATDSEPLVPSTGVIGKDEVALKKEQDSQKKEESEEEL